LTVSYSCDVISEVGIFRRGWVIFGEYFRGRGTSPANGCWFQKTSVIALSCGIKVSAVHHLVLSQYSISRRMDRQTAIPCVALHPGAR